MMKKSTKAHFHWKSIKMKILAAPREIKRNWNTETVNFSVRDRQPRQWGTSLQYWKERKKKEPENTSSATENIPQMKAKWKQFRHSEAEGIHYQQTHGTVNGTKYWKEYDFRENVGLHKQPKSTQNGNGVGKIWNHRFKISSKDTDCLK